VPVAMGTDVRGKLERDAAFAEKLDGSHVRPTFAPGEKLFDVSLSPPRWRSLTLAFQLRSNNSTAAGLACRIVPPSATTNAGQPALSN
jgi:hypothetical protein